MILVIYVLCAGLIISASGCARRDNNNESTARAIQLATPANLSISVVGRLMTVSWDAVSNARGYIVHTASVACASGNRIVNTVSRTATTNTRTAVSSAAAENGITDRGSGFVTFTGATSFTIWLMSAAGSETEAMATSLTARVTAIGDGTSYTDSAQSNPVRLDKANYEPAR